MFVHVCSTANNSPIVLYKRGHFHFLVNFFPNLPDKGPKLMIIFEAIEDVATSSPLPIK